MIIICWLCHFSDQCIHLKNFKIICIHIFYAKRNLLFAQQLKDIHILSLLLEILLSQYSNIHNSEYVFLCPELNDSHCLQFLDACLDQFYT